MSKLYTGLSFRLRRSSQVWVIDRLSDYYSFHSCAVRGKRVKLALPREKLEDGIRRGIYEVVE